jgi:hypothetical protein
MTHHQPIARETGISLSSVTSTAKLLAEGGTAAIHRERGGRNENGPMPHCRFQPSSQSAGFIRPAHREDYGWTMGCHDAACSASLFGSKNLERNAISSNGNA